MKKGDRRKMHGKGFIASAYDHFFYILSPVSDTFVAYKSKINFSMVEFA